MSSTEYDIIIAGGGMVGGLLAAALASAGRHGAGAGKAALSVCVLEAQDPEPFPPGSMPPHDLRVSALSIASQRMIDAVGAWQGVMARRACPYTDMVVWDGEAGGRTQFRARDVGQPVLGHIVENRVLQLALRDALIDADNIDYRCPASLRTFSATADRIDVVCDDDTRISARLLVGADGARSRVRTLAGIGIDRSAYAQHALVAGIRTSLPQQSVTWQRFMPSGPQAFLPLSGQQASMVWYHTPDEVARLVALPDEAFVEAMHQCFPEELGHIESLEARGSFPLARSHAHSYTAQRLVLIGDAAHTVHPLAGQGVNLGLLDAGCLADVILQAASRQRDIGAARVLQRYARWRRGDNALMIRVMDSFYHAFRPQPRPVQLLRSAALNVVDQLTPLRLQVMRQAMGLGDDLPTLARATSTG